MVDDSEKSEADASEQQEPATSVSVEDPFEVLEDLGEKPEADVLEQAIPVDEDQILRPGGSRIEASDADWMEQSIEVPLDEDEDEAEQ